MDHGGPPWSLKLMELVGGVPIDRMSQSYGSPARTSIRSARQGSTKEDRIK
jgi:hypothetical protein